MSAPNLASIASLSAFINENGITAGALWSEAIRAAAKAARESGGHLPGRFLPDMSPLVDTAGGKTRESYADRIPSTATRKERAVAEKRDASVAKAADAILAALSSGATMTDIIAEAIRENGARAETVTDARLFAPGVERARDIRG